MSIDSSFPIILWLLQPHLIQIIEGTNTPLKTYGTLRFLNLLYLYT